jgi:hypothetical protein
MADYVKLCQVVDGVPQTVGMGVVVVSDAGQQILRQPTGAAGAYVVFQFRAGLIPGPATNQTSEVHNSRFWSELWGAGISCGGAVVSGVGVVGAVALAPETGGMSLPTAILLWGGATASAAQCGVSFYRVTNVARGQDGINQAMDDSPTYKATMYVLDGVGLIGAGGAVKEIAATNDALKAAGASWDMAEAGALTRQQRLAFTGAMEVDGVKRLSNVAISRVAKQRLLDLTGAAFGMVGSASVDGGIAHDVAIWVVTRPTN